jgi:peptide/nickel transport system substrate-binding protein
VEAGVGVDPSGLWFNLSPGAPVSKTKPWLQKEQLRHAISLAVDRQAVVDTVYLGAAVPVFGPITPGHGSWYVASLPHETQDLGRARQLLAEIGLKDRNGDGVLEDGAGHDAHIAVMTQKGHTIREKTAALLQAQLKQVGLIVDVVALEFSAVVESINKRDYEAAYFGVAADSFDPARNPEFWFSWGSFHYWNPTQVKPASEWEAKIDDLMRQQSASLDLEKRRQLFSQVQQTMAEHLPIIYFAAPKVTVAMNARVHGATPSVLQPPILWNAEALSLTAPTGLASRR